MHTLHEAAQGGHLEIVKYIAEHSEDKNPTTKYGETPYSLAKRNGHFLIVSISVFLSHDP